MLRAFSKKEISTVRRTWDIVSPNVDHATELFYQNLFEAHPQFKPLFKSEERHFDEAISFLVDGIDDLPSVLPYVSKLAIRHVHYGVKEADYLVVGPVLMKTFRDVLGDQFTREDEKIWLRVYAVLSRVMISYAYPKWWTRIIRWIALLAVRRKSEVQLN